MTETQVHDAYTKRASEYISLFGSVDQANEQDQRFVAHWAKSVSGPVVDVGCGPGHWTAFLTSLGADAEGVDLVPAFVAHAKAKFPDAMFRVASFTDLGLHDGQIGGILAWYSLIHLLPEDLQSALVEFGRCLGPGGTLLMGFFDGMDGKALPHVVTTAYFWSADAMVTRLLRAGLEVVAVQTRADPGRRPQTAMIARRSPSTSDSRLADATRGQFCQFHGRQ
ncbi:class I SAM-dependent methyltransferase [Arthrobacter sp. SO3]|uniref:class I SAM-dependent methyltransferase n=1 Tax=Arthrobacter sp. SO3 TaxID=1897057 RepID=UPI001CFFDEB0|nr:class I SAM-dependent methyltransferase [Arthrobacter sp. SO3]MCB5294783.1 Magnesium-protoporphyrin O-methyltransferase [Arthrobacter sp. SO3]